MKPIVHGFIAMTAIPVANTTVKNFRERNPKADKYISGVTSRYISQHILNVESTLN